MGDNTDRLKAGPTRDSNYSRKYVKEGVYTEAARAVQASAVWNNISEQYPWYGEFTQGKVAPSAAIQKAYELYMRQSEFKKPYQPGGYTEMETNADPPPGINWPYPGPRPSVPPIDEPIVPPGVPPVEIFIHAILDENYQPGPPDARGGYCRGNIATIRVWTSEPCYNVEIFSSNDAATTITGVSGYGTNTVLVQIDAGTNEWSYIKLEFTMRTVEGLTRYKILKIPSVECDEYLLIGMETGGVSSAFVWSMINDALATDVPNNAGTGTVSFPCDLSELANFQANSVGVPGATFGTNNFGPAWEDTDPGIKYGYPTQLDSGADEGCYNTYNEFCAGGTWPNVVIDDTSVAAIFGEDDCNGWNYTNVDYDEFSRYLTVKWLAPGDGCGDPGCVLKNDPGRTFHYSNTIRNAGAIRANEVTYNEDVDVGKIGRTLCYHTQMEMESYWYYNTQADLGPSCPNPSPPPATIKCYLLPGSPENGFGTSTWWVTADYTVWTPLDFSNPLLEFDHSISIVESWGGSFYFGTPVTGFVRNAVWGTNIVGQVVPRSGAVQANWGFHMYAKHTLVDLYAVEVKQTAIGSPAWQGGSFGAYLMNDWENEANWNSYETDTLFAVHAATSYTPEQYAVEIDPCSTTRNNSFETEFETLHTFHKTNAGINPEDFVPTSSDIFGGVYLG